MKLGKGVNELSFWWHANWMKPNVTWNEKDFTADSVLTVEHAMSLCYLLYLVS